MKKGAVMGMAFQLQLTGRSLSGRLFPINAEAPSMNPSQEKEGVLRRVLGIPLLVLYGVGTILGAGIYALIGKVAGAAGMGAPLAFLIAGLLAGLTGLSYAELASRYPKAAGAALYVGRGFGPALARLAGVMVAASGIVSSAVLLEAFSGYLQEFAALPAAAVTGALALMLIALAIWGVRQSVMVAAVITLIEVIGLLYVVYAARGSFAGLGEALPLMVPDGAPGWLGVSAGAVLAFYAFIGFEDMANMAEEAKAPTRSLPVAIVATLVITGVLYVLVTLASILTLPADALGGTDAPLAAVLSETGSGRQGRAISLIALIAIINGVLVQIIMASRLLYGMARQGWAPAILGNVWHRTGTPVLATVLAGSAAFLLTLGFPIVPLAQATSLILLLVFAMVNAALIRIKWRKGDRAAFHIPFWVPVAGVVVTLALAVQAVMDLLR